MYKTAVGLALLYVTLAIAGVSAFNVTVRLAMRKAARRQTHTPST